MSTEITQNSILRISDEKTLELIDLYEKEQCLWNTFIDDYKSRDKRQRAAERIAKKLDVKHFESRHVVIKFKNLRNSYCQELKKIANSLNLCLDEDEVYRPKVFWFAKMDSFLRPHLQPTRCTFPTMVIPEREPERVKSEPQDTSNETWAQNEDSNTYPEDHSDDSLLHKLQDLKTKRPASASSPKRPKLEDNEIAQSLRDMTSYFRTQKEDHFGTFGKYIASLLRTMPNDKALMLQPKIVNLIVSELSSEVSVSQSDD